MSYKLTNIIQWDLLDAISHDINKKSMPTVTHVDIQHISRPYSILIKKLLPARSVDLGSHVPTIKHNLVCQCLTCHKDRF